MADVEIALGGRSYNLRPTFGAMREIEAQTRSSCATLLQLLARQELHAGEMAIIIYWGMLEAGESPTDPEAVGKQLFALGVGSEAARQAVAEYLAELLYAPDSARKKAAGEWFAEVEQITSKMFAPAPTSGSDGPHQSSTEPLPESSGGSSKRSVKNPTS